MEEGDQLICYFEEAEHGKISMVMFDLSGTTVYDDTSSDCLYQAAQSLN
jgi:hypothetical protein